MENEKDTTPLSALRSSLLSDYAKAIRAVEIRKESTSKLLEHQLWRLVEVPSVGIRDSALKEIDDKIASLNREREEVIKAYESRHDEYERQIRMALSPVASQLVADKAAVEQYFTSTLALVASAIALQ